jgi:hypothetical protein
MSPARECSRVNSSTIRKYVHSCLPAWVLIGDAQRQFRSLTTAVRLDKPCDRAYRLSDTRSLRFLLQSSAVKWRRRRSPPSGEQMPRPGIYPAASLYRGLQAVRGRQQDPWRRNGSAHGQALACWLHPARAHQYRARIPHVPSKGADEPPVMLSALGTSLWSSATS